MTSGSNPIGYSEFPSGFPVWLDAVMTSISPPSHLHIYIYMICIYLYFYVLLLVFSVICMSESNAISILCTVHVAELTIKQTLTLTLISENETDYCMEWKDARWRGITNCNHHHSC